MDRSALLEAVEAAEALVALRCGAQDENENHDPSNGQFSSGGGSSAGRSGEKQKYTMPPSGSSLSVQDIKAIKAAGHTVTVYPRRGEAVADGFRRYKVNSATIKGIKSNK